MGSNIISVVFAVVGHRGTGFDLGRVAAFYLWAVRSLTKGFYPEPRPVISSYGRVLLIKPADSSGRRVEMSRAQRFGRIADGVLIVLARQLRFVLYPFLG